MRFIPILAVLISTLVIASCRKDGLSIQQLQMPPERFAGVTEVYVRALVESSSQAESGAGPISEALKNSGVEAAAQYRYTLQSPDAGMRVKVDLFQNADLSTERFRGRHLPEALAMTEALPIGDDGFIYQNSYAGFRLGRVVVEVRAKPDDPRLRPFVAAYAEFVRQQLR